MRPLQQGLAGQEFGDVEHLRDCVHPDDARLPEQRVHGHVRSRQCAGMRTGCPAAHVAPARFHRDNRFLSRYAPGYPAEAAGIAEGLKIQQDDRGIFVILPEFEQVIRGDVNAVADAREMGDAQVVALRIIEQRQAQGPAMGAYAQIASRRPHLRKGRVQVYRGVRVHDAQAVGADAAHAVRKHLFPKKTLQVFSLGTALGKACGNYHDAPDPLRPHSSTTSRTFFAGTTMTARSTSPGMSLTDG